VTGLPVTGLGAGVVGNIRDPFGATAGNGWTPTNVIPSAMFDSVAKNFLQYWPTPNGNGTANNYSSAGSVPGIVDKYSFRVDQNISDKSRFFARWSWDRISQQSSGDIFGLSDPGGSGTVTLEPRWDSGASYTHTFSPRCC